MTGVQTCALPILLDEAVFLKNGKVALHKNADEIREESGKSIDALFREVFKC